MFGKDGTADSGMADDVNEQAAIDDITESMLYIIGKTHEDLGHAQRSVHAKSHALLHGEETDVFADSGYRGVEKREEIQAMHPGVNWHIAMMPGKRKAMDKSSPMGAILERLEKTKASIRAKVEHPFRVIKRQFGYTKVKYRGLAKNTANLMTLFALSNLWMVRRKLMAGAA